MAQYEIAIQENINHLVYINKMGPCDLLKPFQKIKLFFKCSVLPQTHFNLLGNIKVPEISILNFQDKENAGFQAELDSRLAALVPKLPPGVDDIDDEDLENPQLCSEYAKVGFYA